MAIKYLQHSEIDKSQWDSCVFSAPNCLIYGMSWYLDLVCPIWDGLVLDNYDAVMPLPWKKKLELKYIYHPWFAQQLGIFGKEPEAYKADDFIKTIPYKFLKLEITFNYKNGLETLKAQQRNNYILPLHEDYVKLFGKFSENTQRNIRKANKLGIAITRTINSEDFIVLLMQEAGLTMDESHRGNLKKLVAFLTIHQYAELVGVVGENGGLLGAVFFVRFKTRLIYLFSASSQQGKDMRVMFKIVDEIIKENSETPLILDFEGSMNDGIARFYKGFGSEPEFYHRVQQNRFSFM